MGFWAYPSASCWPRTSSPSSSLHLAEVAVDHPDLIPQLGSLLCYEMKVQRRRLRLAAERAEALGERDLLRDGNVLGAEEGDPALGGEHGELT